VVIKEREEEGKKRNTKNATGEGRRSEKTFEKPQ